MGGGGGLISGWAYKRNKKKCFGTMRQNVKANIPLHFEFTFIKHLLCVTINGEFISKTSIKPTYATKSIMTTSS